MAARPGSKEAKSENSVIVWRLSTEAPCLSFTA